jgi:hypothetical protein
MLEKMAGKFLIESGENQQIITRIILTLAPAS